MNFKNEQLALISTLMYCEGIMDTTTTNTMNLETRLREMFYNGQKGDIENFTFNTSPDRFNYPEDLEKVGLANSVPSISPLTFASNNP